MERIEVMDWKYDFVGEKFIKLENGVLLHPSEYNGEVYNVKEGDASNYVRVGYRPIHKGVGEPDEDGDYEEYEVVAFERLP